MTSEKSTRKDYVDSIKGILTTVKPLKDLATNFMNDTNNLVDLLEYLDDETKNENVDKLKTEMSLLSENVERLSTENVAFKKDLASLYKLPEKYRKDIVDSDIMVRIPKSFLIDKDSMVLLQDPLYGKLVGWGMINPDDASNFWDLKIKAKFFDELRDEIKTMGSFGASVILELIGNKISKVTKAML
jgi:hypothetical protein